MPPENVYLIIFAALATIALLMQGIGVLLIYRRLARLSDLITSLSGEVKEKISVVLKHVTDIVGSFKPIGQQVQVINQNISSISSIFRDRAQELDRFVAEATDTARLQIAKLDDLVSNATSRFEEITTILHRGILGPISEISALLKGVRVGFDYLFSRKADGRRGRRAAQDEELFI